LHAFCGLQWGELSALRSSDVDEANAVITVERGNYKDRLEVAEALRERRQKMVEEQHADSLRDGSSRLVRCETCWMPAARRPRSNAGSRLTGCATRRTICFAGLPAGTWSARSSGTPRRR
jgi:integrase